MTTHADLETLVLLALGDDDVPAAVTSHVDGCPACQAELTSLRRVVGHARDAADVVISTPRPQVWDAIRDAVAASSPPRRVDPTRELRAHASLLPVHAAFAATGEAEVSTDDRGRRMLQVTLRAELPAQGLRQAWLVHREEPDRRQTLGILDDTSGLWSLDRSIDLEQWAFLEISQQELGSTQHSGETLVRGELLVAAA